MKKKSIFARYITPVCNLISILDAAEQSPVTCEQVAGEQERIARLLQNGTEAFFSLKMALRRIIGYYWTEIVKGT